MILILYFLRFHLFTFFLRERGEERKKEERNIDVWETHYDQLPLAWPQPGTWPKTQACALTGNQTSNHWVHRPALNPLSHTSQGKKQKTEILNEPLHTLCHVLSLNNKNRILEKEPIPPAHVADRETKAQWTFWPCCLGSFHLIAEPCCPKSHPRSLILSPISSNETVVLCLCVIWMALKGQKVHINLFQHISDWGPNDT